MTRSGEPAGAAHPGRRRSRGSAEAEPAVRRFPGPGGVSLAYREIGAGRPLILIHGYLSSAEVNWLRPRVAARIADRGHRVVLPDLRGHGESGKPHDPAAYPPDVLAEDGLALIDHLGLADYDLGGYSLGARTVLRMLALGARPRRAVVAGMGVRGVVESGGRGGEFRRILTTLGSFEPGSREWQVEAFLRSTGGDPVALLHVLNAAGVNTPLETLAGITVPTLVVAGADDERHDPASVEALADAMPGACHQVIPGNHMTASISADLAAAITTFLAAGGCATSSCAHE